MYLQKQRHQEQIMYKRMEQYIRYYGDDKIKTHCGINCFLTRPVSWNLIECKMSVSTR